VGYRFFRTSDWGYNRVFDPARIEVVSVSDAVTDRAIERAVAGKGERRYKAIYQLKQAAKRVLPARCYRMFRDAAMITMRRRPM